MMVDIQDFDESEHYAWQSKGEEKWKLMDGGSNINHVINKIKIQNKRKMTKLNEINVRLGMMRYLILFIDMTESMKMIDLKPTRLNLVINNVKSFIDSYFDQNPISQISICLIKNGVVLKLTDLSGNIKMHLNAINSLTEEQCSGDASLENILLYSETKLKNIPQFASREVLIVISNISSADHDNIHDIISSVQAKRIRCSVISLTSEIFVYKKLTKLTLGQYLTILDEPDLKICFKQFVLPPPSFIDCQATMIHMGFPSQYKDMKIFQICSCHRKIQRDSMESYNCPRCGSSFCDIPVECTVCGLMLVSAPHLARSYHHLFPLEPFVECQHDKFRGDTICTGCNVTVTESESVYKCTSCNEVFCSECDDYLHTSVHVCPSCKETKIIK